MPAPCRSWRRSRPAATAATRTCKAAGRGCRAGPGRSTGGAVPSPPPPPPPVPGVGVLGGVGWHHGDDVQAHQPNAQDPLLPPRRDRLGLGVPPGGRPRCHAGSAPLRYRHRQRPARPASPRLAPLRLQLGPAPLSAPRPSRLRQSQPVITPLRPPRAGRGKGAAIQDPPPGATPAHMRVSAGAGARAACARCPRLQPVARVLPARTRTGRFVRARSLFTPTPPNPPPVADPTRVRGCRSHGRVGQRVPSVGLGRGRGRAWSRTGHGWDAGGAVGRGHSRGVGVRGGGCRPRGWTLPGAAEGAPTGPGPVPPQGAGGVPHPPQTCTPTCTWCSGGSRCRRGPAGAGRGCRQARGSAAGQVNVSLGCGSGSTGGRGRQQERERWHR